MKLKHTSLLVAVAGLVASNAALAQQSTPVVVYDNTTTALFQSYFAPNNEEYGDQIWLSSPVIADGVDAGEVARAITKVEFEYFAQDTAAGDTATLNIYDFEPGNPNAQGLLASVSNISLIDGFNTATVNFAGDNAITVRNSLTWTVAFNLADTTTSKAGLSFYGPATVTGATPARVDDFWVKTTGGTWESQSIQGGPAGNFGARFTAVPEPSVIVLGFLAGISFLGMRSMRRKNG
jgi:hypothetical protein